MCLYNQIISFVWDYFHVYLNSDTNVSERERERETERETERERERGEIIWLPKS